MSFVTSYNGEVWAASPFFPGYSVSTLGRVRSSRSATSSKAGQILKPWKDNGYWRVSLSINGVVTKHYVHQLVAIVFLGPAPSPWHEVAHWDGDRGNDALSNLRWATHTENAADAVRHGTFPVGERHRWAKLRSEGNTRVIQRFTRTAGAPC